MSLAHQDQLQLPFAPNTNREDSILEPSPQPKLLDRLRSLSHGRIAELTLTENRSTILSAKPLGGSPTGRVALRIHRSFEEAPDPVLEAVVDFASKRLPKARRRAALSAVREYFDQQAPTTEEAPRRREVVRPTRPRGRHHDLQPLYEQLNHEHFADRLRLSVTWGRPIAHRRRRRRTIQLGSFRDESKTVTLHPVLDQPEVPKYVLLSVLHHEMLHAVVPAQTEGSRRRVHTPEFREREQAYEHHQRAEAWLGRHLFRLMGRLERSIAARRRADR